MTVLDLTNTNGQKSFLNSKRLAHSRQEAKGFMNIFGPEANNLASFFTPAAPLTCIAESYYKVVARLYA
ncbi:hypothetical protein, partial [Pseudomonas juntendi]|uniref:hypothetical protein n=1 Tax=Pseudomonas juntendi TaxID=2666183 RepID=UPI001C70D6AD